MFHKEIHNCFLTTIDGSNTMKNLKSKLGDKMLQVKSDVVYKDDLESCFDDIFSL